MQGNRGGLPGPAAEEVAVIPHEIIPDFSPGDEIGRFERGPAGRRQEFVIRVDQPQHHVIRRFGRGFRDGQRQIVFAACADNRLYAGQRDLHRCPLRR